jgi:hypothetical protein
MIQLTLQEQPKEGAAHIQEWKKRTINVQWRTCFFERPKIKRSFNGQGIHMYANMYMREVVRTFTYPTTATYMYIYSQTYVSQVTVHIERQRKMICLFSLQKLAPCFCLFD